MADTDQGAGERPAGSTARRQNTKPSVSAKRPRAKTARVQLHLGETTLKRLAVHAALVGRNQSRVADEVLSSYLDRYGRGRELFADPGDSPEQLKGSDGIAANLDDPEDGADRQAA
jgi:hypothetical protein